MTAHRTFLASIALLAAASPSSASVQSQTARSFCLRSPELKPRHEPAIRVVVNCHADPFSGGNKFLIYNQEVFTFMGATRERYSLEYWCRRFDIESPKGSIDGSQVSRVYRAGRIDDIGEYCLRDVRATAQLYQKLSGTMLPLFAGGE